MFRHQTQAGLLALTLVFFTTAAVAAGGTCPSGVDPQASTALQPVSASTGCQTKMSHGYPIPDPDCTPGAFNPTVTIEVLQSGDFKTPCVRDQQSSPTEKRATYSAYGVTKPSNNTGQGQTCELDHLVSLELGGGDGLDNIWPQCGPKGVKLNSRFFKIKDGVENYLAAQVRAGTISLSDAQRGIATDWTQYIAAAHGAHTPSTAFGSDQTPTAPKKKHKHKKP